MRRPSNGSGSYYYRVGHLVEKGVGLTFICYVPPAQPFLPISHQPKQNRAEDGTAKNQSQPNQLSEQMPLPILVGFWIENHDGCCKS